MTTETDTRKWTMARIGAGLASIIPTAIPFLALRANGIGLLANWFGAGFVLAPATVAAMGWWFTFRAHHSASRARMMCALIWGLVVGGIAFLGGFIGPLILTPEANQGPLLGIFITGPLGFCAGILLGTLYSFVRVRPPGQSADQESGKHEPQ